MFFRQYMPKKPTKWVIKVWMISESKTGYLSNFDVYLGKASPSEQAELGMATKVVPLPHQYSFLLQEHNVPGNCGDIYQPRAATCRVDHSWDHLLVPAAVNPSDEGTYRNANSVL